MNTDVYSITAANLAAESAQGLPDELRTDTHLIYNSPGSLDFNSPGASSFGVKRAALAIPGSIMLLISPACCGRNTAALSGPRYAGRCAYLELDENDIVTGKHLAKIPAAVAAFVASRPVPPSAVSLCITCVDALLGTDMERVARRCAERVHLPVIPCYMYALTRESSLPPMVYVRESIYKQLQPRQKDSRAANILGFFTTLAPDCELFELLHGIGIKQIRSLGSCRTYAEFERLAEANFNLVLSGEVRSSAAWMEHELQIPAIELKRVYSLNQVDNQYKGLGHVLGTEFDTERYRAEAEQAIAALTRLASRNKKTRLAVGSQLNADPFELASSLIAVGLDVAEIFGTPQPEDAFYLKKIAAASPATRIYTALSPSMLNFDREHSSVTLAIGTDAIYYHPRAIPLSWNDEAQPFGYQGITLLYKKLLEALTND